MLSGANNALLRGKNSVFRQAHERAWSNLRPIRQAQGRQAPRDYARDRQDRQAPRDPSTSSGQARPGQAGQVEHGEKIEGASGSRDRLVRPLAQRQKKKTLTDRGMVASEGQSLRE
ncbi:MAG: hypothetical protein WBG91_13800 [Syntrophobacteria bacterium]